MLYFVHGSAILTAEEAAQPSTRDKLTAFYAAAKSGKKAGLQTLQFSTGALTADNVILGFDPGNKNLNPEVPFKPIGIGTPLCLMIREIYTGKYPKGGIFGSGKGLLVASAVKSLASFDAKPRALNFLLDKLDKNRRLSRPPATKNGTPFLFYSPALLDRSLTLDLEVIFDNFPKETFDAVGGLFTEAGSVPVFQAYSTYLFAAGILTKLLGQVGEAIFDGKPSLRETVGIDIALPGAPPTAPGFLLVTGENVDDIDPHFREKKTVSTSGQVLDELGKLYQGDVPYIVISLDGTPSDDLKDFAPTAASAAVLSRFYGIKDGQSQSLSTLIDALKLYSDFRYRREIDNLDKQIAKLDPKDPALKDLLTKREALLKNILEEIFKPK